MSITAIINIMSITGQNFNAVSKVSAQQFDDNTLIMR